MKAYLIADITVHDLELFSDYLRKIVSCVKNFGGEYLVKGAVPTSIEGNWSPSQFIVIEFTSRESASQFVEDEEVKSIFSIRHKSATSKLIIVNGLE